MPQVLCLEPSKAYAPRGQVAQHQVAVGDDPSRLFPTSPHPCLLQEATDGVGTASPTVWCNSIFPVPLTLPWSSVDCARSELSSALRLLVLLVDRTTALRAGAPPTQNLRSALVLVRHEPMRFSGSPVRKRYVGSLDTPLYDHRCDLCRAVRVSGCMPLRAAPECSQV